MRVFLGNAPWRKSGLYGVRAGSRWPHFEREGAKYLPFPWYLGYSTALLEREGHDCLLVDAVAERSSEDSFVNRCADFRPDLVLLECATASFPVDLAVARRIRERVPDVKVVFCGLHPDMYRPGFLDEEPAVDFVLHGEYEYTLVDLVRRFGDEAAYPEIRGLIYRNGNGKGTANPRRESIRNLDELPWPARDHLPMHNYHDIPGRLPEPSLQMWASRGCPYQCNFCAWPQIMYGEHRYRTRNPVDVVDEIEHCLKRYGLKSFYFDDDTFNIGKPRMMRLADEIRRRNLGVPWAAMARADTSDRETLELFRESGLVALKFGVESASQEIVNRCGKNLDLRKVEESVRACDELGIKLHLTFTFGLDGETPRTIRDTIDLAKRYDPESVQFSIITPFPGSRLYEQLRKEGRLRSADWSEFDGGTTGVIDSDTLSAEDLERAVCTAYREWERHKVFRLFKRKKYLKKALREPIHGLKHFLFIYRSYRRS